TPHPNSTAFVHLDAASPRPAEKSATEKLACNEPPGPLHGIPVTVKSCIEVAGLPNPAGSLLRAKETPAHSAPIVDRLRAAGAILLGTTNTPEFLMAYETNNRLSGATSNPWNFAYSSGGSSGAATAALPSRSP